jgi:quercetin dioxygenase-like cupin family protein
MVMDKDDTVANFVSPPGAGRPERVLGVSHIFKAESSQTAGKLICIELTVPPGQGVPPHRHADEDEAFYVLSGAVMIQGDDCGPDPIRLEPGGFFYGPRGRVHSFRNDSDEAAKLVVFITPGANIERMFTRLADLTKKTAPDIDFREVAAICEEHHISFVGAK